MELDKAIKILVAQEGTSILTNPLLVNHLMDLQAFEVMPASKYIIKLMVGEGFLEKLRSIYKTNIDPSKLLKQSCMDMIMKWGFQKDAVNYTINNIAVALGWQSSPISKSDVPSSNAIKHKTGNHFCFKGIEIAGDIDEVVSQLTILGYNLINSDKTSACLEGTFAGEAYCKIWVWASEFINDEVYSIAVALPEAYSWDVLRYEYETFKEKLTKKYGAPFSTEKFYDPYFEGDGYELSAFEKHKALYTSNFTSDKGHIRLSIAPECVYIVYYDNLNESRIETKKESIADMDL